MEGWVSRNQTLPALQRVDFHYHDAEEWLEVAHGDITFSSLSGQAWPLHAGSVLQIPRGEVHQAEIGAQGVEYRMHLPVEMTGSFINPLTSDEMDLLRTNLAFPIREENIDGRAAEFFAAHLSDQLTFRRADGTLAGKEAFRDGFTARDRASSGTVSVLSRTDNSILLSTVVIVGASGKAPKHFTNIRLFEKESGVWKCRIWVNYS